MDRFVLKISGRRRYKFRSLALMYRQQCHDEPGTHYKPKPITISSNGVRNQNISGTAKHIFRNEDMPEIAKLFPNMPNPFSGHLQFIGNETVLNEAIFILK
jgi:hypothetical protein